MGSGLSGLSGLWAARYRRIRHMVGVTVRRRVSPRTWTGLQSLRVKVRQAQAKVAMPRYPGMPLLSIIVAAYDTEDYVVAALASLRNQQWPKIEVIVVDDGSSDDTAARVAEFAAHDKRFRLVRQANAGPGAARNRGAALARGKYIAFFDSDDLADPFFYRQAVIGLELSGSDFAIGAYDILIGDRRLLPPRYIRELHQRSRRHLTLASLPAVMTNALICTRVFRREFYVRAVAPQPEGVFYEDQILAMRAFVRARGFDLLHQSALQWRRREIRKSTTQRSAEVDNLRQRTQAYRQVADFLAEAGLEAVRRQRLAQILATNQLTLNQLAVATQEYCDVARDFLEYAIAEVGEDTYERTVDLQDRVLQTLVRRGDLAAAQSFLLADGRSLDQWVFHDDPELGPLGWLPNWPLDQQVDLPPSVRRPSERQRTSNQPKPMVTSQFHDEV